MRDEQNLTTQVAARPEEPAALRSCGRPHAIDEERSRPRHQRFVCVGPRPHTVYARGRPSDLTRLASTRIVFARLIPIPRQLMFRRCCAPPATRNFCHARERHDVERPTPTHTTMPGQGQTRRWWSGGMAGMPAVGRTGLEFTESPAENGTAPLVPSDGRGDRAPAAGPQQHPLERGG